LRAELDGQSQEVKVSQIVDDKSLAFLCVTDGTPKKVRVVGRQVSDFLSVDYQQVYMTAVSALQEVDRRLQLVEQREARMETLENELAQLRKVVADIQASSKKAAESASATGTAPVSVASGR
jgi:hypothetical protein